MMHYMLLDFCEPVW